MWSRSDTDEDKQMASTQNSVLVTVAGISQSRRQALGNEKSILCTSVEAASTTSVLSRLLAEP